MDLQHSIVLLVKPHELYPRGTISSRLRKTSESWSAILSNPSGGLWLGSKESTQTGAYASMSRGTGYGRWQWSGLGALSQGSDPGKSCPSRCVRPGGGGNSLFPILSTVRLSPLPPHHPCNLSCNKRPITCHLGAPMRPWGTVGGHPQQPCPESWHQQFGNQDVILAGND